ncbi:MAG: hypothetical protein NXH99_13190 [Rhodobacteraceae bacterium]|nr:hypothetical protein [Paracoccaceae bacterium]
MRTEINVERELTLEEFGRLTPEQQLKHLDWDFDQLVAFADNGLKAMYELEEAINTPATPEQEAEWRKVGEEYRRTNAPTVSLIEDAVTEAFSKRMTKAQGIVAVRA